MAQAIKNKDVRKNCVDVDKVIMEYVIEIEKNDILALGEPVESLEFSKDIEKLTSNQNAVYHQGLIPINQVHQNLVYKNYYEYNR
ncbi:MAG: hypothetical protein ACFFB9_16745 [Promethearchaeota archaeon]